MSKFPNILTIHQFSLVCLASRRKSKLWWWTVYGLDVYKLKSVTKNVDSGTKFSATTFLYSHRITLQVSYRRHLAFLNRVLLYSSYKVSKQNSNTSKISTYFSQIKEICRICRIKIKAIWCSSTQLFKYWRKGMWNLATELGKRRNGLRKSILIYCLKSLLHQRMIPLVRMHWFLSQLNLEFHQDFQLKLKIYQTNQNVWWFFEKRKWKWVLLLLSET